MNCIESNVKDVWIVNRTVDLVFYDGSEDGDQSYWYFHRDPNNEASQSFDSRSDAETAWDTNTIIWST